MKRLDHGIWEIKIPLEHIHHLDYYKLFVCWEGGCGERIPAWSKWVVQDKDTHIFCARVWDPPTPYRFKHNHFIPDRSPLLIYECHVGMATEEEKVGTYDEFRIHVLPRVKENGYNAIQVMAIQEHPTTDRLVITFPISLHLLPDSAHRTSCVNSSIRLTTWELPLLWI